MITIYDSELCLKRHTEKNEYHIWYGQAEHENAICFWLMVTRDNWPLGSFKFLFT